MSQRDMKPWIDRAVKTFNFHAIHIRDKPGWALQDTAASLNRSIGSVSQDLLLASWIKTDREEIEKFEYLRDAIEWCRKRSKILRQRQIYE